MTPEHEFIMKAIKIITRCVADLTHLAEEVQKNIKENEAYRVTINGKKK